MLAGRRGASDYRGMIPRWFLGLAIVAGCGNVAAPSIDAPAAGDAGLDASIDATPLSNLLRNGDFTQDTLHWTAVATTLSIQNGALRLEQTVQGGPGLAWQMISGLTATRYRISAKFVAGSHPRSYQIRVGTDTNDGTYANLYDDNDDGEEAIDFSLPAGTPALWVTLNNVSTGVGDYAVFDDVVLTVAP